MTKTTKRTQGSIPAFIVSHATSIVVLFAIVGAILAWQARNFSVDASPDTLVIEGDANYIQTQLVNERFSPQEFLLIAYQPKQHAVLSEQTFTDLEEIAGQIRDLERVDNVRSILNVPLLSLMDGNFVGDFDPNDWTIGERDFDLDQLSDTFRDHPVYEDLVISKDQKATALQVLFKPDQELEGIHSEILQYQRLTLDRELSEEESKALSELQTRTEPLEAQLDKTRTNEIERIRQIVGAYGDRADIYLGGIQVLNDQLIEIIETDLMVFGAAVGITICILLFFCFGRLRWVLIPVICCVVSVLSTMGLLALLDIKTTVISSNFVALQLILTLALVVHLIVQYRENCIDDPDADHATLIANTLARKAAPCFYAGITTSVGFAALLAADIKPVISFGWMMIIATSISLFVSLTLFPALLAHTGKEKAYSGRSLAKRFIGICEWLALKHRAAVMIVASGLAAASLSGIPALTVENSFIDYFRDSTLAHQELSFIDQRFGGSIPLDIIYSIPDREQHDDLVMTAETAFALKQIHEKLNEHEAVGKILSVATFTGFARMVNQGTPLTEYELTAIYRTLDESLREDLIGSLFSPEHDQARFSLRIQDTTPDLNRAELLAAIKADLQDLNIPEEQFTLTGLFILYQDVLEQLFKSLILTLGIVYFVLTITFIAIFRSIKLGLIGIVPNILATLAILGTMGWLGIPLDLMTITIAAIAMGIAVDDTIHYIHRYQQELQHGDAARAISRSHFSVGYAIVYTSVILIAGFSMLLFSDFMPSTYFGLLTGLTLLIVMLIDLCVLPTLLYWFVPGGKQPSEKTLS